MGGTVWARLFASGRRYTSFHQICERSGKQEGITLRRPASLCPQDRHIPPSQGHRQRHHHAPAHEQLLAHVYKREEILPTGTGKKKKPAGLRFSNRPAAERSTMPPARRVGVGAEMERYKRYTYPLCRSASTSKSIGPSSPALRLSCQHAPCLGRMPAALVTGPPLPPSKRHWRETRPGIKASIAC